MYQQRTPAMRAWRCSGLTGRIPGCPGRDGVDGHRSEQGPAERAGRGETAWLCLCTGSSPRSDCPPAAQAVMSDRELWGGAGQLSPHQLLQLLLDGRGWGVSWAHHKASLDASKCTPSLLMATWPSSAAQNSSPLAAQHAQPPGNQGNQLQVPL